MYGSRSVRRGEPAWLDLLAARADPARPHGGFEDSDPLRRGIIVGIATDKIEPVACRAGKLFDDRGNRMSPSHAAKGGRRWRYYVSQATLRGLKHEAGSVARAPALEIEARVAEGARAGLARFQSAGLA
jgi:hypothetical protein